MSRKGDQEESSRARTNVCEMMRQLCWKGSGAVALGWGFYVLFLVLSTHPCWQSSDCWAALFVGSQGASKFVATQTIRSSGRAVSGDATGLEHIVFGIAASADKWKWRKEFVDLWWQKGKNRGFVWLDRATSEPWPVNSPPFKISEDTSRFKFTHPNGYRSAIRISRIVSETFRLGLPNVRWFVMGDDDTVFFTENLVKVLGKYDHNQYYYIGSNSEGAEQNAVHSFGMAYGGGGFAISYPLAKALARIQDDCLDRYSRLYGSDQRVHACLTELGVPLTKEPGFHQTWMIFMERMVIMIPCVAHTTIQWELLAGMWMHHWYGYLHMIGDMVSWFRVFSYYVMVTLDACLEFGIVHVLLTLGCIYMFGACDLLGGDG